MSFLACFYMDTGGIQVDLSAQSLLYMGSCQNYGPFLGTLKNRRRIILR